MPTKKTRIALSVPDDIDKLLTELSNEINTPKTSIIVSFLEEAKPTFQTLLDVLKKRTEQPRVALSLLQGMMEDTGLKVVNIQSEIFKIANEDKQ